MLVGVVGLNGSGKDTVAILLKENYDYKHKDIGQEIREELKKIGKNYLNRKEMVVLANERRKKFGNDYWAKKVLGKYSGKEKMVITSIRNPAEIEFIKKLGGKIIVVQASIKKRFWRTVERVKKNKGAHGDVKSFDEFKRAEEKELESKDESKQQLSKCISLAEYEIDNNSSISELKKELDQVMIKIERSVVNE